MIAIREERLRREEFEATQALKRQRDAWAAQVCLGRDHEGRVVSRIIAPGRRGEAPDSSRYSSRSRSPGVSEVRGREETRDIPQVSWKDYMGRDPSIEEMSLRAQAVVREFTSGWISEAASAGEAPCRFAYVGLTRYLRGRWYGSERIPPEYAHCHNFQQLHVLGIYSRNAGEFERAMIRRLRLEFGQESLANEHAGGGGVSRWKPNFLYICLLPTRRPSHRQFPGFANC